MSVITTYLNDNVQTPLGRFVVYTSYTTNFATDGAYALVYRSDRRRWDKQWSVVDLMDPS